MKLEPSGITSRASKSFRTCRTGLLAISLRRRSWIASVLEKGRPDLSYGTVTARLSMASYSASQNGCSGTATCLGFSRLDVDGVAIVGDLQGDVIGDGVCFGHFRHVLGLSVWAT